MADQCTGCGDWFAEDLGEDRYCERCAAPLSPEAQARVDRALRSKDPAKTLYPDRPLRLPKALTSSPFFDLLRKGRQ